MSFKNVQAFCKDNSNTIFTVFGVILTIGAVAETVHATLKAKDELEEAEYEKWEDMGYPEGNDVDISLSPKETLKIAAPKYIFATILLASAITCDICAHHSSQKKIDKYAGAYLLVSQMLGALQESARENLSPSDFRKVEAGMVRKRVEADMRNPEVLRQMETLQSQGPTSTIYRDGYSPDGYGVYLKARDIAQCKDAVHILNSMFEDAKDDLPLNDWYYCLNKAGITNIGRSDLGDMLYFTYDSNKPFDLYAVPAYFDTDTDTQVVMEIGLRRRGTPNDKAYKEIPTEHRSNIYGDRW